MTSPALLSRLEDIIDASGSAPRIEALLPAGVRHRQLRVRTLPPDQPRSAWPLWSLNVVRLDFYSDDVADEQLGLDATAAEQAVVSVFEQIVAVLARQADAAITDAALFRLADTLFAAFARAGEDGLTASKSGRRAPRSQPT